MFSCIIYFKVRFCSFRHGLIETLSLFCFVFVYRKAVVKVVFGGSDAGDSETATEPLVLVRTDLLLCGGFGFRTVSANSMNKALISTVLVRSAKYIKILGFHYY